MPRNYKLKKALVLNSRGNPMPPKRGPAKGTAKKNRDPIIEAAETDVGCWAKKRADEGLILTSRMMWNKYFFFWPGESIYIFTAAPLH